MELPDSVASLRKALRRRRRRLGRAIGGLAPIDKDSRAGQLADLGPEYRRIVDMVRPYTKTSPERVAALCLAVDYVVANNVPGAIVECGLYKGGSLLAAALRLLDHGAQDRDLFGYDTFAGMTAPSERDVSWEGKSEIGRWPPKPPWPVGSGLSEQDIRAVIESNGWRGDRLQLVAGPVEETIPKRVPSEIALLRLDTDWYESTRHELEHLYPNVAIGGVLIIDDYGHYRGAREAVDEYFSGHRIFLSRIDYTGRVAVKQSEYHAPHVTGSTR